MGPPDDGPILNLEGLRLDRAPPATATHRHVPFLKARLKLSTPHLPSDRLYNEDLIDQRTARFTISCNRKTKSQIVRLITLDSPRTLVRKEAASYSLLRPLNKS